MKNDLFKGVALVSIGAACYGLLATIVRLAYNEGYTTAEVTFSQSLIGVLALLVLNIFFKNKTKSSAKIGGDVSKNSALKLLLAGTSLGLTSTFYYFSVQTIPVSVAIVLLMQTIWMGVVVEAIREKRLPSKGKMFSVLAILFGTVLATNMLFDGMKSLALEGLLWGLAAACSYTVTLSSTNTIALELPLLKRTLLMLLGGLTMVSLIFASDLIGKFDPTIIWKYGLFLALFGTILPPILFNRGMPLIGVGLGSILSSIEIPVSVLMAYFILGEQVAGSQWFGILIILATVVVMNLPKKES